MALNALRTRDRRPELMDDPGLDPEIHRQALAGLARLNRASRVIQSVERALLKRFGDRDISILDIAAGSGDLVCGLAERAALAGRRWSFEACDISDTACDQIGAKADSVGDRVRATRLNVLEDPLPAGHDVVMCHLFLHHLNESEIVAILARMRTVARDGVLVTDLVRNRLGYTLAWLASRVLTRSPIVHTDALLSVRGALTVDELASLASDAGMVDARIRKIWPERMMLWCQS
tara:strand:- start:1020 stop:1721 length:702 start_codon:yes stop_codon:yes gene_type:complete